MTRGTILDGFLRSARAAPDAPAVSFGPEQLTYRDLDERSDALARRLRGLVARETPVAFRLRKGPDALGLMLACLRAGLPYVPVDVVAPAARVAAVLERSRPGLLVHDDEGDPPAVTSGRALRLDELVDAGRTAPVEGEAGEDDLAYVLFTSGSTGDPKGVTITQRNAAAFVHWAVEYAELRPTDRVAVHAPLHFDLPVFDVFGSLAARACVVPLDESVTLFPQALLRRLASERVSVLYAVPSALIGLLDRSSLAQDGLPHLRLLLYAGEEFHPTPLARLAETLRGVPIHNWYGPIETNVVTAIRITPELLRRPRIPLGREAMHAAVALLDGGAVVEEPDREGEIVVAGPTVSPGYLGDPELTRSARVRLRVGDLEAEWHRTGDWGSRDAAGVLHFHGRRDGMVKTRGFRVELGDVEAALAGHPAVSEAAVVARADSRFTNLLYAFVVPGAPVSEDVLEAWCRDLLPAYMVPQRIRIEERLPRTSTGKIARRELFDRLARDA